MGIGKATKEQVNEVMNRDIAEQAQIVNPTQVKKEFDTNDTLKYVKNDTYIANPGAWLGKIFYEAKGDPTLIPFILPIKGVVDKDSVLKSPQTRKEMILDSKAAGSLGIMSYLSLSISQNEVFEFRVIDNTAARMVDTGDEWQASLEKWMATDLAKKIINDPEVERIGVVTGVVQKYVSTKKYKKFEVSAKGGAFGVNVGGELYTSSSEYALDIVYGLDLVYLPKTTRQAEFRNIIANNARITDRRQITTLDTKFIAGVALNKGLLPNVKSAPFAAKIKKYT